VCRIVNGRTTVAWVADAHVAALDAQIGSLKVSRAVLYTVATQTSHCPWIMPGTSFTTSSRQERLVN